MRSAVAAAAALAVVALGAALTQGTDDAALSTRPPAAVERAPDRATEGGLPTVAAAALPVEARRTLALIADGGPFPYEKDGAVFGNREGVLPQERRGCYREYTVRTPGRATAGRAASSPRAPARGTGPPTTTRASRASPAPGCRQHGAPPSTRRTGRRRRWTYFGRSTSYTSTPRAASAV